MSSHRFRALGAAAALALAVPVVTASSAHAVSNPLIKRAWTHLAPATAPSARQMSVMAYDAVHGETVLFGGQSGPATFHDDTWVWNGATWTQRTPAHQPSARSGAVMAYDTVRKQVVLFGGYGYGPSATQEAFADTWTWDGTDWTEQHPLTSPSPRAYAAGSYDSAHGQIVVFGGRDVGHGATSDLSDTWTWTGVTWLARVASGPPAGINAIMSDAPTVGGTLMHGNAFGQTWAWNGATWTAVTTTTGPGYAGYLGFDPVSADLVAGGGGALGSGTWAFDGTDWREETPTTRAPDLYLPASAYDLGNRRLVVFGGADSTALSDATWTYGF